MEASSVLLDERALLFDDSDHSDDEDRFLIIGMSYRLNICIVCHCCRGSEEALRIISA